MSNLTRREKLAYATIAKLEAENEALKAGMAKQANAVTLMRSVVEGVAKHNAEKNVIVELSHLRSQLESEREANSQLTQENEEIRKESWRKLKESQELNAVLRRMADK
jgi:hypothetical protein